MRRPAAVGAARSLPARAVRRASCACCTTAGNEDVLEGQGEHNRLVLGFEDEALVDRLLLGVPGFGVDLAEDGKIGESNLSTDGGVVKVEGRV